VKFVRTMRPNTFSYFVRECQKWRPEQSGRHKKKFHTILDLGFLHHKRPCFLNSCNVSFTISGRFNCGFHLQQRKNGAC